MSEDNDGRCLSCECLADELNRLNDQQRKRLPTEKPQDGEVVLVKYPNGLGFAMYRADADYGWWDQDGEETVSGIECWWPIKHLLEGGE